MLRSEIEVPASCRADQQVCLLGGSDQHEGNVYIAGKQNRNMYFLSTVCIFVSFTVNRLNPQIFYRYFLPNINRQKGFHELFDFAKVFDYKVRKSHVRVVNVYKDTEF